MLIRNRKCEITAKLSSKQKATMTSDLSGIISRAILNSTSKNTLSSLLCLCLLFNKIRDMNRFCLEGRGEEGEGERGWWWGRNDPNNVHVNK
jgi:hypothetical protein